MLINLEELVNEFDLKIKGILHVGAHEGNETPVYQRLGIENVVWVEANPEISKRIPGLVPASNTVLNYLVTDVDDREYAFKITNNEQSSSILDFGTHAVNHSDVVFVGEIKMKSKKLDSIINWHNIDMGKINFLNLDIQGAELLALEGMEKNLEHIDHIYSEVNTEEVYKGCALLEEMDAYLYTQGFVRKAIKMTGAGWGDAYWGRKV